MCGGIKGSVVAGRSGNKNQGLVGTYIRGSFVEDVGGLIGCCAQQLVIKIRVGWLKMLTYILELDSGHRHKIKTYVVGLLAVESVNIRMYESSH